MNILNAQVFGKRDTVLLFSQCHWSHDHCFHYTAVHRSPYIKLLLHQTHLAQDPVNAGSIKYSFYINILFHHLRHSDSSDNLVELHFRSLTLEIEGSCDVRVVWRDFPGPLLEPEATLK